MGRRRRPRPASERAQRQAKRIGTEVAIARSAAALSCRDVDRLAGVAQSTVRRIERGDRGVQLDTLVAVGSVLGLDVVVRAYPGVGLRLRDSGQLHVASSLGAMAHDRWRTRFEVPAGEHGEAADMVLYGPDEVLHIEIERALVDLQAQLRSATTKRGFLSANDSRPVRLVIVVEDTRRNRVVSAEHASVIRAALPGTTWQVRTAIVRGEPLGRDGLFWVRPARLTVR